MVFLVSCGALISTQATINVALGRTLGLWLFAFIFTVVQLVATLPTLVALSWPPRWSLLAATPSWQLIGGVLGMPILAGMAYGLGRTGTFTGLIALLVGQMAMGLVIDRLGLFQAPVHVISPQRIGGFILVVAGLLLAR